MYQYVPPCTASYQGYRIPDEMMVSNNHCRNVIGSYVLVCTGMYNFDISRTASYPEEDVLVCTSTYHLVLPRTRGTGFQMSKKKFELRKLIRCMF